jgi:SAM-dependent methyltransferase
MSLERMTMIDPDWLEMHVQRYVFACQFAPHRRVLDCACGEGYGSDLLSRHSLECVGVDISADAIDAAVSRYGSTPSLKFIRSSITSLPFDDGSFDLVVCFETIEHLDSTAQQFVALQFRRVLRKGGLLLLSTRDRPVSAARRYSNPFHKRELTYEHMLELLDDDFRVCISFRQELNMMSVLSVIDNLTSRPRIGPIEFGRLDSNLRVDLLGQQNSHSYMLFLFCDKPVNHPLIHAFGAYAREPACALWNRIEGLRAEVSNGKSKLEEAVTSLQYYKKREVELSARVDRLQAEHAQAWADLRVSENNNAILTARLDEAVAQHERLTESVRSLEAESASAREALSLSEKNNMILGTQCEQLIAQIHSLEIFSRSRFARLAQWYRGLYYLPILGNALRLTRRARSLNSQIRSWGAPYRSRCAAFVILLIRRIARNL